MILGSSFEFEKSYNPEIIERPTDNTEIPQVKVVKLIFYTSRLKNFHFLFHFFFGI